MNPVPETRVACLTPPSTAAIATLAVRGPDAWAVVRLLFRPRSRDGLPAEPEAGRFWLGRLGDGVTDEAVLAVKRAGPTPWLELHCHGGREVVRLFLQLFESRGVTACSWRELVRRTTDDPLQALAAATLAEAPTVRTAAILLDQYHGTFRRAVEAARAALQGGAAVEAGRLLKDLARYAGVGRHLTNPWRVTVAGAPNVGKSSLVNALAGYPRCVVAATPGTTRDVVTTRIAVDGWPVELADTAGLRAEAEGLEEAGIRQAQDAAAAADLCLWVLDGSAAPVWPTFALESVRLVVNKVDLPPAWDWGRAADSLQVSARTGAGLPELCVALGRWVAPEPPPAGAAIPFTDRLGGRVAEALGHLSTGRLVSAEQVLATILAGSAHP